MKLYLDISMNKGGRLHKIGREDVWILIKKEGKDILKHNRFAVSEIFLKDLLLNIFVNNSTKGTQFVRVQYNKVRGLLKISAS